MFFITYCEKSTSVYIGYKKKEFSVKFNKSNPSPNDNHSERDLKGKVNMLQNVMNIYRPGCKIENITIEDNYLRFFLILEFVNKGMRSAQIKFTPKDSSLSKIFEG